MTDVGGEVDYLAQLFEEEEMALTQALQMLQSQHDELKAHRLNLRAAKAQRQIELYQLQEWKAWKDSQPPPPVVDNRP